ncbi:hypothetical protein HK103_000012 [Boothiomyces macroporosus]|uniref:RING-type domain-containing protein n=1 Tax=Boothiomyces macroporosus TaxID=261099 RepID=A0AAD5UMV6_9FUNG|nr:hypothetical protein HK103_000012 [Boothiomyces macroporosus]
MSLTTTQIIKAVATNIAQATASLPQDMLERHNMTGNVHHSHIRPLNDILRDEERFLGRKLTPEEVQMVTDRVNYLRQHEGHEKQHSEMLMIIFGGLIVSQILITIWKKYHVTSYNISTLLGLWFVPIMSLKEGYWRFCFVWLIFSVCNGFIVARALEKTMKSSTPRLVYWWFQKIYDVSMAVGAVAYSIILFSFFHIPMIFGASVESEANIFMGGLTLMFYALYFGTLGRDFVDRLSDQMATKMGFYSRNGFPTRHIRDNMCAICGEVTRGSNEKLHQLNCSHTYHEICIRGWTIVGKKDICPCCKEKVDMRAFKTNSWDTTQALVLNFLDFLRYILVWNPIVFYLIHEVIEFLGLK